MARLEAVDPSRPQHLDAWLKGPVYYDTDVRLRVTGEAPRTAFALDTDADERPAILGRWRTTEPGDGRLADPLGRPA